MSGPEEWPLLFPQSCAGENQSPIDIQTNMTVPASFEPLKIINYGDVRLGSLLENGHTVQLRLPKNKEGQPTLPTPSIEGGGLPGTFLLDHIHFHWGNDDTHGSEHFINSKP